MLTITNHSLFSGTRSALSDFGSNMLHSYDLLLWNQHIYGNLRNLIPKKLKSKNVVLHPRPGVRLDVRTAFRATPTTIAWAKFAPVDPVVFARLITVSLIVYYPGFGLAWLECRRSAPSWKMHMALRIESFWPTLQGQVSFVFCTIFYLSDDYLQVKSLIV
jgi:hypothetical protein